VILVDHILETGHVGDPRGLEPLWIHDENVGRCPGHPCVYWNLEMDCNVTWHRGLERICLADRPESFFEAFNISGDSERVRLVIEQDDFHLFIQDFQV